MVDDGSDARAGEIEPEPELQRSADDHFLLYESLGAAGDPPPDEPYNFAVYAIVLLLVAAVVVPLAIWFAVRLD
jgi:hypothetical protein